MRSTGVTQTGSPAVQEVDQLRQQGIQAELDNGVV